MIHYFKKSCLALSLIAGIAVVSPAQYAKDYTPIKSSGTLPDEFLKTARSLSEAEVKTVGYGKDHLLKEQFVIYQNYFLQNMLVNGDVLVNDELTKYVNRVADELLKGDSELRNQLHIYVIKNSDVNAHSFDKGYIFVNIGLLAQLENEAQLAYILAHEIIHVKKKHSVTEYIENIKLSNGTSDYETGSNYERELAKYRFSKEEESEADIEGLKLVKASKYSVKAVSGAFDVLQYSYLPFELIDFKKSFLEDKYLQLPDTLVLKKTDEVKSNDDYDDTKSSHPNIRKRRASVDPELKVDDESSRKKYLVSEADFKNVREMSRFELCRLYLMERDYINSIYACYILMQKYPDNLYLKKTMATAMYNIAISKAGYTGNSYFTGSSRLSMRSYSIPDYKKIEGPSQRVYYMFDNMSDKEANVVALSYVYNAHKAYPKDALLSEITDSLFSVLVKANNMYLGDFAKMTKQEIKDAEKNKPLVKDTVKDEEESKYSKIKKEQQKIEVQTDENFLKYAFVGDLKDDDFVNRFNKYTRISPKDPEVGAKKHVKKDTYKKEPMLGINKIIFTTPYYLRTKIIDNNEYTNYYESEDQQKVLLDIEKKCADKLKLGYAELNTKDFTAGDIDKFNDNGLIQDWIEERLKHGDNNNELISCSEDVKKLIEKLGTKYVCWSGIYNRKGKVYRTTYFFIVFDLESGQMMKFEVKDNRGKDHQDLLYSEVYNSIMHVAGKEKKE
jgi:predicted Zn-dependent protease